jgi:hypothetical protein
MIQYKPFFEKLSFLPTKQFNLMFSSQPKFDRDFIFDSAGPKELPRRCTLLWDAANENIFLCVTPLNFSL